MLGATDTQFWTTTGYGVLLGAVVSLIAQAVMFVVEGGRERRRSRDEVGRQSRQQQLAILSAVVDDLNQATTAITMLLQVADPDFVHDGSSEPALIVGGSDAERSLLLNTMSAHLPLVANDHIRELVGSARTDLVASFAPYGGPDEAHQAFVALGEAKKSVGEEYRAVFQSWSST